MTQAWSSDSGSFSASHKVHSRSPFLGRPCPQPCPRVLLALCGCVSLTGRWLLTQVSSEHVLCLDSAPLFALTQLVCCQGRKPLLFRLSFVITTRMLKTEAASFLTASSIRLVPAEPERSASSGPALAESSGTATDMPPASPPTAAGPLRAASGLENETDFFF